MRRDRIGRGRTPRWWAVMPVVGLVALAGCSKPTTAPRMSVVGDSMTAVEQADLAHALTPPYAPNYVIRYNGRIAELSNFLTISINRLGSPDILITNAGSVDARTSGSSPNASSSLAPLLSSANGVPCVVLTTVNTTWDQRTGNAVAHRINRQIVALEHANPTKYKVVDWNHFVSTLPAASLPVYVEPTTLLETPAGARWLAQADLAAVRACNTTHQPTVMAPTR